MFAAVKQWCGRLRHSRPGQRFQRVYANALRRRQTVPLWHRLIRLGLAAIAFVLGLIFVVLPGPAFIFFILAGALMATESHGVAVALDWLELRLRALGRRAKRRWQKLRLAGRIVVVTTGGVGVLGGAAFLGWLVLMR